MKVLIVNYTLDPLTGGGTAERTFQLTKALSQEGIDCTLLSYDLGTSENLQSELKGVSLLLLPSFKGKCYFPLLGLKRVFREIQKADVIHLMSHFTFLNILVYFGAQLFHKPIVLCPAGSLTNFGRSQVLKRLFNIVIGKRMLRGASERIIISPSEVNDLKYFLGEGIDNPYVLIPNGVVLEDFRPSPSDEFFEQYHIPKKPFILFLGRLNPIKGPDILLEAFINIKDEAKNLNLVFAGPDQGVQESLMSRASEVGISERIYFTGHLNQPEKVKALSLCEFLVIPSRKEAMSIVVLEAGAVGKAVVLTDQCGLDELEELGLGVVREATVRGITDGLREMARRNANQMAHDFQKYVEDHYSWQEIVKRHLELFKKVISAF